MYLPPSFVDQAYALSPIMIGPSTCMLTLALLLYRSFDKTGVWRSLFWAFGSAICAGVSLTLILCYFSISEPIALQIIFISPSVVALVFLVSFLLANHRHLQLGQRTPPRGVARVLIGFLTIMFATLLFSQVILGTRMYYLHSRVSFYSNASAAELEQIAGDYLTRRSHYLQFALISNPKTSLSALESLLTIDDADTLNELAFNGATPASIVERLRVSKYESVRRTAAQNRYSHETSRRNE